MVGGLTSYYTYQHKSANHARTRFEGLSGVSEVLRFAGLGLLLGQMIDDECGFHGIGGDKQVTTVPHGFQLYQSYGLSCLDDSRSSNFSLKSDNISIRFSMRTGWIVVESTPSSSRFLNGASLLSFSNSA